MQINTMHVPGKKTKGLMVTCFLEGIFYQIIHQVEGHFFEPVKPRRQAQQCCRFQDSQLLSISTAIHTCKQSITIQRKMKKIQF